MKVFHSLISALTIYFSCVQGSVVLASSELSIEVGYRHDELRWSTAGFDNTPNILSELKWEKLQLWQVRLRGKSLEVCGFYVRYSLSYGKIFDGKVQDSDYFGDNRTREFSRGYADAGRGEVFDTSFSFGYMLHFFCGLRIAPLLGTSYHMQNLHMYDGIQVVNSLSDFLGKIKGLDSRYKSRWKGSWVGADLAWDIHSSCSILGTFEYHSAKYRAKSHWNLNPQFFDDFTHRANGHGTVVRIGAVYQMTPCILISLMLGSQGWRTGSGCESTKIRELLRLPNDVFVERPVKYKTKLNKVKWTSYEIMLGLGYSF